MEERLRERCRLLSEWFFSELKEEKWFWLGSEACVGWVVRSAPRGRRYTRAIWAGNPCRRPTLGQSHPSRTGGSVPAVGCKHTPLNKHIAADDERRKSHHLALSVLRSSSESASHPHIHTDTHSLRRRSCTYHLRRCVAPGRPHPLKLLEHGLCALPALRVRVCLRHELRPGDERPAGLPPQQPARDGILKREDGGGDDVLKVVALRERRRRERSNGCCGGVRGLVRLPGDGHGVQSERPG